MARQRWGTKLGIILAVAGSAIGLGNFLRFPSVAAQNGGGAFMIPYFVALILLGLPLMWVEWTIGRFGGGFGHSTAPGMFHTISNKNRFIKLFGVIGIFGPIAIFVYYTYIESWLLGYSYMALTGKLHNCTGESLGKLLDAYLGVDRPDAIFSGTRTAYIFFLVTFALNLAVVYGGIRGGIEKVCNVAVPILLLIGLTLLVRVFTLGTPDPLQPDRNVVNGLGFLWNPKWDALANPGVWLAAAGQIFFTLSVGIGVILTYASYLQKDDDVILSGLGAAGTNEFAEVILGGSIVLPAAFVFLGAQGTMAAAAKGTFNLGFITMPLVIDKLPMAGLFGFLWFALLFIAGITSSISLAQPAIAFLEDEFGLNRKQAVAWFGAVTFVLCHACVLLSHRGVIDELDYWVVNLGLVGFGLVEVILFGWVFGMDRAWSEMHAGSDITIPRIYRFIIKYVTPLVLIGILGWWFCSEGWEKMILKGVKDRSVLPYMLGTRGALVAGFCVLAVLVWHAGRRRARREGGP